VEQAEVQKTVEHFQYPTVKVHISAAWTLLSRFQSGGFLIF